MNRLKNWVLGALLLAVTAFHFGQEIKVDPPKVFLGGIEQSLTLDLGEVDPGRVTLTLAGQTFQPDQDGVIAFTGAKGKQKLSLTLDDQSFWQDQVRFWPAWIALLPALFAVLLAFATRQVLPSLFAGVVIGACFTLAGGGFSFLKGLFGAVDYYGLRALVPEDGDSDHMSIIIMSLLLGGMVGIITRGGGSHGIAEALTKFATSVRRGQLATWAMGLLIFFDDYANTLIVGNTVRPVTDRLKISREKLAFLVDATAAPVASIALISTWIGFEVGLIGDAIQAIGLQEEAYSLFLASIPYRFYPVLMLAFIFMLAWQGRDFGPMLKAERRARKGELKEAKAQPLASFDDPHMEPSTDIKHRAWVALVPIFSVICATLLGLWFTGLSKLGPDHAINAQGFWRTSSETNMVRTLGDVFSEASSFKVLIWASFIGCLVAMGCVLVTRVLSLTKALEAWTAGIKSMVMAVLILILAWSVGQVTKDLEAPQVVASWLGDAISPGFMPLFIFALAAVISFATGSSWTTMTVLFPIAVPLSYSVAVSGGLPAEGLGHIVLSSIASVLAGSVFGDHCSPLSDTTVMSSMASSCDHMDHVKTQLPYALTVGVVGMLLGDLATGYGAPLILVYPLMLATLWFIIRYVGKRPEEAT